MPAPIAFRLALRGRSSIGRAPALQAGSIPRSTTVLAESSPENPRKKSPQNFWGCVLGRIFPSTLHLMMISIREAARRLGVGRSTIYRWAQFDPTFPNLVRLSKGTTRIRLDELNRWISTRGTVQASTPAFVMPDRLMNPRRLGPKRKVVA